MRAVLNDAARELAAVSPTPRLDAELLMAHVIGASREQLLLRHLDDPAPPDFDPLLARRRAHEPVAYITGRRAFWTIELAVGPGVLIPRPDSETLIEAAVAHFGAAGPARVLDLGTGPGTLLLAALAQWPGATGLGIDASATALEYARANAEALGLAERATFQLGDWAAGVTERFDLILANPPYIGTDEALPASVADYEPAAALYAGPAGLDAYRVLLPQLSARLAPGGVALVEIGARQSAAVGAIAAEAGLKASILQDLGERDRVLRCDG
ncbi:MAG: peptide chain release factor N(5)-glutamine methyltransferase [Sphingomonas sp.]|uniref:peptide chain release factor N(5)-glutamine methyltransferase n=1 Tax=Sphingomonas sp. TaxID=28214 RepID=UPI0025E02346|nr:peptide chain release factor N(5)-glutamine methyltransferase [Sphingomonas sp.]MBX9883271.1 peptide chain release factor N(5)-glutamine methyltransferase [Sphingomonas sp.]